MRGMRLGMIAGLVLAAGGLALAEEAPLERAREALRQRQFAEAIAAASEAIEQDAKPEQAYWVRGLAYEGEKNWPKAVEDFSEVLKRQPEAAEVYQQRGMANFKGGRVEESLADFDRYLKLRPEQAPGHWMRGISCYYAGKFAEGQKQFEGYQTVDDNDVENVVWRALCMAGAAGKEKAREEILAVGFDRRVPMPEVYELFAGKLKPEDVLKAAQAESPQPLEDRMFYAHLYLGLWYEMQGDAERSLAEMKLAAENPFPHYMGDVARVHLQLRQTGKKQ
jgi:lipoprotein NlpI